MTDYFIAERGARHAWTYAETHEAAERKLAERQEAAPDKEWLMVEADAFAAQVEASYLDGAAVEITEGRFHEMLGILPPVEWRTEGGIERFCMSEFTFGRITTQFARIGVRYFEKPVRFRDHSTYITAAALTVEA